MAERCSGIYVLAKYTGLVPGEHCGNSKNFWLDGDTQNVYTCENDGLLMTQKNTQYIDGEYFTFVPDTLLNDSNDFSSINYFPHDYRVQVQTTILYGEPSTCVSVEVHIQDFQGGQWFSICADRSWYYSRCDLQCNTSIQVASGNLAHASHSYLIRVDVTDTMLSLYVNNTKVTSINDSTYHTTNQLEIGVYGNKNLLDPNTALFSDFSYTPSP